MLQQEQADIHTYSNDATNGGVKTGATIVSVLSEDQELARSFQTIVEMLADRGVHDTSLAEMSTDDVLQAASGRRVFYIDDPRSGHRIVYDLSSKFSSKNIKKMLETASAAGMHTVIAVIRDRKMQEKSMQDAGVFVQFFDLRRLQFNISRHRLVPKHEPIRDEAEIESILKKYMVKSRFQLPIIYDKDPMAQYLAMRHGELVRITRNSPTSGVHVLYRCCCTRND